MAEVYSSLFKGLVHITTPFSKSHPALDIGNYKTKNSVYSPNRLGYGKVSKQTTSYTYNGVLYKNTLTQWTGYGSGVELCFVHGSTTDKVLSVGNTVNIGQKMYVTGNTGYSKGDHLHVQMKINGVLVDPSQYLIDDKDKAYPLGTKIQLSGDMNIRSGKGVDIGDVTKGAVCEVISDKLGTLPKEQGNYLWYNVRFLDKTGYIADLGKFIKTTKTITQTDGKTPAPVNPCQTYIDKYDKLNESYKEIKKERDDLLVYKKDFDSVLAETNKRHTEKLTTLISEHKEAIDKKIKEYELRIHDIVEDYDERLIEKGEINDDLGAELTTKKKELAILKIEYNKLLKKKVVEVEKPLSSYKGSELFLALIKKIDVTGLLNKIFSKKN